MHVHPHAEGSVHTHAGEHIHIGEGTFWALFIIFVLGPCEPLIPLLMYPAARHSWYGVVAVTLAFGIATIGTMMTLVGLSSYGLMRLRVHFMERFIHALAGGIIALSGMAIKVLGV